MENETQEDQEHPQRPATGEHAEGMHALSVEAEAQAHGLAASIAWDMRPGANQGGNQNA